MDVWKQPRTLTIGAIGLLGLGFGLLALNALGAASMALFGFVLLGVLAVIARTARDVEQRIKLQQQADQGSEQIVEQQSNPAHV